MSSTDLVISPIAIPPALREAGVTVIEQDGVRTVHIPASMKATHNVVQPVSEMTQADPDWSPRLVVVDLSGEQYSYTEQSKQALTKNGILLLAHAAGIEVDVDMVDRAQLRDSEIGFKATASVRRSDGTIARWTASKIADLDEEKARSGNRWAQESQHIRGKTESKAILRAVSLALQLQRGGYTKAQLQLPFLIVGVSSTPSDPEVRRARALSAAGDLYGKRALALAPAVEHEHDDSPAPAQIAPPADVVDIKPSAPAEPDPAPVAGEVSDAMLHAGEVVIPEGFRATGLKVGAVAKTYLEHLADPGRGFEQQHPELVAAARLYLQHPKHAVAS